VIKSLKYLLDISIVETLHEPVVSQILDAQRKKERSKYSSYCDLDWDGGVDAIL
jgi:hypothetical protein